MWSAVRVAFKRDRGHGNVWELGEPSLERVLLRLAVGEPEAPPIVVNRNGDVIRIVEGSRRPIERSVIEIPLRRGGLPNEPRKVARITRWPADASSGATSTYVWTSYGQPCSRRTGVPFAGPVSA